MVLLSALLYNPYSGFNAVWEVYIRWMEIVIVRRRLTVNLPYYVSPLTERWGYVALPLSALSVRSAPFISASAFYSAGVQTRYVKPILG